MGCSLLTALLALFQPTSQIVRADAPGPAYPVSREFVLVDPAPNSENGHLELIGYFFWRQQVNGFAFSSGFHRRLLG
jgi:hypothetical protein